MKDFREKIKHLTTWWYDRVAVTLFFNGKWDA